MRVRSLLPAGFTLVELAVSVVVTALILSAAVGTVFRLEKSWDASQDRADVTRNSRAALEMLARDLRMAGSGFAGRTLTTGGAPDNRLYPLQSMDGGEFGTDTLVVISGEGGLSTVTTAIMASPSGNLLVEDAAGFAQGDLVVVTDGDDANLFEVTSLGDGNRLDHAATSPYNDPNGHDAWPAGGYPSGSTVVKVEKVSYWIDDTGAVPKLYRRMGSGIPLPLAHGVEALNVRFVLADGSVSSDPDNPALIRSVQVDYVGKMTNHALKDTVRISTTPRVIG